MKKPDANPTGEGGEGAVGPVAADEAPGEAGGETAPANREEPRDAGETIETLKDRWLRTEADLQNFRRRARRDVDETRRSVEDAALLEVISFLDDLERALSAADASGASGAWAEGVRLVANRMGDYLTRYRVQVVDPIGQRFDPGFHEAVLETDAPEGISPGHVAHVVLKGYRRDGRVLRAARVVVARAGESGRG